MTITPTLDDLTSPEHLDRALHNAKEWSQANLTRYLPQFQDVDYSVFHYQIDNSMIGTDMQLTPFPPGLIRVSARKIRWFQEREESYKTGEYRDRLPVEIDPQSMFVHMIAQYLLTNRLGILTLPGSGMLSRAIGVADTARTIENHNRRERGLRDWPKG